MTEWHFYEPRDGHGLPHDPLNAMVAPRPIGWISTVSADGVRNIAPYSFFNLLNYTPPLIGFSSMGWKDSVANINATGEFVWSLATRDLAEAMNATAPTSTNSRWRVWRRRPRGWLRRRGWRRARSASNAG